MTSKNMSIGFGKISRRIRLDKFEKYISACEMISRKGSTLRAAASECGISKSALHRFITNSLSELKDVAGYKMLYKKVHATLNSNLATRARRGGQATKRMYSIVKNCSVMTTVDFEVVDMFHQTCLFTNDRVSRTMLNNLGAGLYAYDLRMNDNQSKFITLETSVFVNHGGTIICKKPILETGCTHIVLTDDTAPNFLGEEMTLAQFVRAKV